MMPLALRLQSVWLAAVVAAAVALAGVLAWLLLPTERLLPLLGEEGPIEGASATLYFVVAAAAALYARRGTPLATRLALAALAFAFGLRELDLHKAWTGETMLRLSFYWSDAPLATRLAAAAPLALLGVAALYLGRRYARAVWRGARAGRAMEATLLTFAVAIVASKLIDRSLNAIAEWFGIGSPPWLYALQASIEEPLELALPLLLLLALAQHRAAGRIQDANAVSTPV